MVRPTHWGDWASSQRLQFWFDVGPGGWATAGISLRGLRAVVSASHVADALGDLLRAVSDLCVGAEESRCAWAEDPGEFRWILRRAGGAVLVRIVHVTTYAPEARDDDGHTVWEGSVPLQDLVRAVVDAAQSVLEDVASDPSAAGWQAYGFPHGTVAELESHLASWPELPRDDRTQSPT